MNHHLVGWVETLRKKCPVGPVDIRLEPMDDNRACCERIGRGRSATYRITIDPRDKSEGELRDLLCHEWAHAMCWKQGKERRVLHGSAWGINVARCYRALVG